MASIVHSLVDEAMKQARRHTELILQEQLAELVSRGLLTVRLGDMTLVHEPDGKIGFRQTCELVLSNQEYVEALEKERNDLKARVEGYERLFVAIYDAAKKFGKGPNEPVA